MKVNHRGDTLRREQKPYEGFQILLFLGMNEKLRLSKSFDKRTNYIWSCCHIFSFPSKYLNDLRRTGEGNRENAATERRTCCPGGDTLRTTLGGL